MTTLHEKLKTPERRASGSFINGAGFNHDDSVKNCREWFGLTALAVKACVGFAIPAVLLYHAVLNQPGMFPHTVNMETKPLAVPVQTGCMVACALLLIATLVELFWHRYKRAVSDLAFALLALLCWSLCAGLTVRLK